MHTVRSSCFNFPCAQNKVVNSILIFELQVLQERKAEHRIRKAQELAQKENKTSPTSADVDDNVDLISK